MRRILLAGLLLASAAALAAAQEAPRPAPRAKPVDSVRALAPGERVQVFTNRRARLGVSVNLRARETDSIGALLQSVTPGAPAAQAGLQTGDIITRFNGTSLVDEAFTVGKDQSGPGLRLIELAALLEPGDTVRLEYRRGAERRKATVVAGDEPLYTWRTPDGATGYAWGTDPEQAAEAMRRSRDQLGRMMRRTPPPGMEQYEPRGYGPGAPGVLFLRGGPLSELELAPMNADLGRYFGTAEGVLVIRAPAESKLGLRGGDVVLSVDGRAVASPGQLIRILGSYETDEPFRVEVMRMKKKESLQGKLGE